MTDHKPLVHIGMAKAASTFLQLEVFPNLSGVHNMGKHSVAPEMKQALMSLTRLTSIDWPRVEPQVTRLMRAEIDRARDLCRRPALSEEDLSVYKFLDPDTMAGRLHAILGDFDVLLMIRNPLTWLPSNYLFRLEHQNKHAVLGFENWLDAHLSTQRIGSDVGEIWFGSLARTFRKHCGGRVHILPYELMRQDRDQFATELAAILSGSRREICGYLNTPENRKSHKIRVTETQRRLFEAFRWIDLQQPERFVMEVRSVVSKVGYTMPAGLVDQMAVGTDEKWDREKWAIQLRKIAANMPSDEAPARPTMSEATALKIRRLTRSALLQLSDDFGFHLNKYGLSYI